MSPKSSAFEELNNFYKIINVVGASHVSKLLRFKFFKDTGSQDRIQFFTKINISRPNYESILFFL